MEFHLTDLHSFAIIDNEIGDHNFTPAQYEILRRVIFDTADFEYKNLLRFSDRSLKAGAAALAARTTIIVDVPMVQVGIVYNLQNSFANPVYCSTETITRPQKSKTQAAWGMQTLAKRYPESIFVIGSDQTALHGLVELIGLEKIKPALIIATPSSFIDVTSAQQKLKDAEIPYICIKGRKGSASVAVAIVNGLADIAWQAYGQENTANN
jgi:precorrin-8X/cobalt-precorrin-8 methylmutase